MRGDAGVDGWGSGINEAREEVPGFEFCADDALVWGDKGGILEVFGAAQGGEGC